MKYGVSKIYSSYRLKRGINEGSATYKWTDKVLDIKNIDIWPSVIKYTYVQYGL